jgi:hypothetical protein
MKQRACAHTQNVQARIIFLDGKNEFVSTVLTGRPKWIMVGDFYYGLVDCDKKNVPCGITAGDISWLKIIELYFDLLLAAPFDLLASSFGFVFSSAAGITFNNSTSKTKVECGGICPPAPRSP